MPNVTVGSGGGGRGDRPRRPVPLPPGWLVERDTGEAGPLFARSGPAAGAPPTVRLLSVERPALVLGSTQPEPRPAPSVEVVRRRSGGGAVLLRPGEMVWVDVVVPRDDRRWSDDVARSFHWLGDTWAAALATLGVGDLSVHRGTVVRSPWSDAVCFAGVGPGEVVCGAGGKAVGMASRRTREAALFQCAVPLGWDPAAYVALLGLPPEAVEDLAAVARPVDASAEEVFAALLRVLE